MSAEFEEGEESIFCSSQVHQCTVYSVHCTVYSVQCTVCSVHNKTYFQFGHFELFEGCYLILYKLRLIQPGKIVQYFLRKAQNVKNAHLRGLILYL